MLRLRRPPEDRLRLDGPVSASKRKGSTFERAVVEYLADHGFPQAERRVSNGTKDRGDVAGIKGWVLEVKNCARIDLAGFMAEAKAEAANAGVDRYAAVVKKRQHGVADAYAVVPFWLLAELLADADEIADLRARLIKEAS